MESDWLLCPDTLCWELGQRSLYFIVYSLFFISIFTVLIVSPFFIHSLYPPSSYILPSSYTHCIPLLHILIVSPFFIHSLYPPSSYILPSSYTHCIPLLHILIVSPFFIIYTHCYSRVVVNPRRACARVTVVVLCVCQCICLFPL